MAYKSDLNAMVLGVLQQEPMHGYEIAKRIKQLSGEALKLGEGQLYPTLHGLEQKGQVSSKWQPQDGKPARKVYALTDQGRKELESQRTAWSRFSQGVASILAGAPNAKAVDRG